jgi:hypothetical protein
MSEQKDNDIITNVARLPLEMKRTISSFFTYDTKIDILYNKNKESVFNNKSLSSCLTIKNAEKLYTYAVKNKIYRKNPPYQSYNYRSYDENDEGLKLVSHLRDTLPPPIHRDFVRSNGRKITAISCHPVVQEIRYDVLQHPSIRKNRIGSDLINSFETLKHIEVPGSNDFNYYMKKVAYHLLATTIIYCNTVKADRIDRSQAALLKLTVEKAKREQLRLLKHIEDEKKKARDNDVLHTSLYRSRIRRARQLLKERSKYMSYIQEGMTITEAKALVDGKAKEIKDKEDQRRKMEKILTKIPTHADKMQRRIDKQRASFEKKVAKITKEIVSQKMRMKKLAKNAASLARKRIQEKLRKDKQSANYKKKVDKVIKETVKIAKKKFNNSICIVSDEAVKTGKRMIIVVKKPRL